MSDNIDNIIDLIQSTAMSICNCDTSIKPIEMLVEAADSEYDIDIVNPIRCRSCNAKDYLTNIRDIDNPNIEELINITNYILAVYNCWCDMEIFTCVKCEYKEITAELGNINT